MTSRLVCRSAPLPTNHIIRAMEEDCHYGRCVAGPGLPAFERNGRRIIVATPQDTDVGQCWSEEVFSMLEGER